MGGTHISSAEATERLTRARSIAKALGYDQPTALQHVAFDTPEIMEGRDVFVVGATSSGKTLIPLLLYYEALLRSHERRQPLPRLLFAVPYRALAAQKLSEIQRQTELLASTYGLPEPPLCVQSTGEFRQADGAIRNGGVDVAVIIVEKVYRFASEDPSFLSRYDFVVLDEVGLVDSEQRGARVDFVMTWAQEQRRLTGRPRTIALGTPSFDWSAYIEAYDYLPVQSRERPVSLEEYIIEYRRVDKTCFDVLGVGRLSPAVEYGRWFHPFSEYQSDSNPLTMGRRMSAPSLARENEPCSVTIPARRDETFPCPKTAQPCSSPIHLLESKQTPLIFLLERICRWHLGKGHQVLIFKNNREEVRVLARVLWQRLASELMPQDSELRAIVGDPVRARAHILEECGLEAEDLYSVMEDASGDLTLYQALLGGIGFHSAAVPHELRSYVEKHLLERRDLSIVCCTETLAYGVNSAVDVVIIADIIKQAEDARPLTTNEYQNYIGRAGRLRQGRSAEDGAGHAYVLLSGKTPKQLAALQRIRSSADHPAPLHSKLFDADNDTLPFFLLNMVPPEGARVTRAHLREAVERLPMPHEHVGDAAFLADFRARVNEAIDYLESAGLIIENEERFKRDAPLSIALTEQGERLRGYIISTADYELIRTALKEAFAGPSQGFVEEALLYRLISSRHVEQSLNSGFFKASIKWSPDELQSYFEQRMGVEYSQAPWLLQSRGSASDDKTERLLYVLAALTGWTGGASPGWLYDNFGVQYPLVQKMSEQIGYLIEIAACTLRDVVEEEHLRRQRSAAETGRKRGLAALAILGLFDPEEVLERGEAQLRELHLSVFYGIDRDVRSKLIDALVAQGEETAAKLAETYRAHIDPQVARTLRRIGVRYRFFERPAPAADASVEERNNYRNQRWQYVNDIRAMEQPVQAAFATFFPDVFPGSDAGAA